MQNFIIVLFIFLPGCAVWEQTVKHSLETETAGQTLTEIGTTVSMFQPQIGIWIVTVGGLVFAAGKMLNLFKKKGLKNGNTND